MTDLVNAVLYPEFFHYWLIVSGSRAALRRLSRDHPSLTTCIDLAEYSEPERCDIMQTLLGAYRGIHFDVEVITKDNPNE